MRSSWWLLALAVACKSTPPPAAPRAVAYALPDVHGPLTLDLLAYDRARGQVWIPVGEGGSVYVFSIATKSFSRVTGFASQEREVRGQKRTMGPSAAAVGNGFVYVSDRASSEVCAVNDATLVKGRCLALASPPDVIAYVAAANEIWVTTPKAQSIAVLDATHADAPSPKLVIAMDGEPECYAVDPTRRVFYTNLEDKNRLVAIDVPSHAVRSSWPLDCSERGPRGVAVDAARDFVFVACADHVEVLDAGHGGARLASFPAGEGVDAIDYEDGALFVAAGKSARLTVARFGDAGAPRVVAVRATAPGARNAVVAAGGASYVVDPRSAELLELAPPP